MANSGAFQYTPPVFTTNQQKYYDYAISTLPPDLATDPQIQVIVALLAVVVGNTQDSIDNLTNLIDVDTCPDTFLPYLASVIGYNYDYTQTADNQRLLIKNYAYLRDIRGSALAIKLAARYGSSIPLNTSDPVLYDISLTPYNFQKNVPDPTTAPTLSASGTGSSLTAGTYTVGYTFTDSATSGETLLSPTATVTVTAGQSITVSGLTLSGSATGANVYVSSTAGSSTLYLDGSSTSGTFTVSANPTGTTAPPTSNTTGDAPVVINGTSYTGPAVYKITVPASLPTLSKSMMDVNPAGFLPILTRLFENNFQVQIQPNVTKKKERYVSVSFYGALPSTIDSIESSSYGSQLSNMEPDQNSAFYGDLNVMTEVKATRPSGETVEVAGTTATSSGGWTEGQVL